MPSRLSSLFSSVAKAIRSKGGTSAFIKAVDMPSAISNISFLGQDVWEGIINGTPFALEGTFANNITSVQSYVFAGKFGLSRVSLPNCQMLYSGAFMNCSNLTSIYAPRLSYIHADALALTGFTEFTLPSLQTVLGNGLRMSKASYISLPALTSYSALFYGCSELLSFNIPSYTSIYSNMFLGCAKLPSLEANAVTSIGTYAFSGCVSLSKVSFPAVTTIGNGAFSGCSNLSSVYLPACITLGSYVFSSCIALKSITLNSLSILTGYVFYQCGNLETLSLPVATSISGYAFFNCVNFKSLYLPSTVMCTGSTNMFVSAAIIPSRHHPDLKIYVPASLVDSYKVATGWSSLSSRFVSL